MQTLRQYLNTLSDTEFTVEVTRIMDKCVDKAIFEKYIAPELDWVKEWKAFKKKNSNVSASQYLFIKELSNYYNNL